MGMWRVGNDRRAAGVGRSHVEAEPKQPVRLSFSVTPLRNITKDPAISPAIIRSRRPSPEALKIDLLGLSRLMNSSPLSFTMEPTTRLLEPLL